MNENATTTEGGGMPIANPDSLIMKTPEVKELFSILEENGKNTTGLTALINYAIGMEELVKQAESKIAVMQSQIDAMKEIQDHPIKNALQKTVDSLKIKVAEIKGNIAKVIKSIVNFCKKAVDSFKENGAVALNGLASFFEVKKGLQEIKNDASESIGKCDKAVEKIQTFSKEYHESGRHIKNMLRVAVGKKPIDAAKESGKLAKAVCAPYKAEKACLLGIRNQVDKMIAALDKLEKGVEANKSEKAAKPKKPTLEERLAANKAKIAEREREKPQKERPKLKGAEI